MDALPIQSDSDCPSPAAVQADVRELTTPEQRAAVPVDAKVLVSDHDDRIAVAITRDGRTTVRVYQDAARDCARRSHFVSVLVVVSLMPPDVSAPPEPEPEPEGEPDPPVARPAPVMPAPAPAPPKRVRIELCARAEIGAAIEDTVKVATLGGALGVALGSGNLRLTLGTAYLPPSRLRFTAAVAGEAELERLDVALGLRWMLVRAPFAAHSEVAALASRAEVSGRSPHQPRQDTAFSLGGRIGLGVSWAEERTLSPFLAAHASVYPAAPALVQVPQGRVGHLPYLWLGLSAGLALAL